MRHLLPALALALAPLSAGLAQEQFPILDQVAQKVIAKYQNSSCVQLAEMRSEQPTGEQAALKQRAVQMLQGDPQMRQAFLNQVAPVIANKLFECGMIP